MKKTVGIYDLGLHAVKLILDFSKEGGHFTTDSKEHICEITVGANQRWEYVMQVLMHEAFELSLLEVRGRFRYTPDNAGSSDSYVFHFDHNQFSEAAARVGTFVSECLPAMGKVYNKFRKK
jgi:hypothetical protein